MKHNTQTKLTPPANEHNKQEHASKIARMEKELDKISNEHNRQELQAKINREKEKVIA